jgi:3-(methylthio)propanoyl-CoA dehydrogenase
VAQAALSAAQAYAAQRVQMGKPIREHPLVAEMLLDMQTTVAAMRALWMEAAVAHDLVQALAGRLRELPEHHPERAALEQRQRRISRYLRDLTPLVKYFNAEEAIRVARTSLQVFGGNGVIKENDVERYVRDSLILPIYEGTSQIQALMAVKDLLRHVMRDPRHLLTPAGIVPSLADTHFDGELAHNYGRALRRLSASVQWLMFGLARDLGPRGVAALAGGKAELSDEQLAPILLSAEWLTQMLAHLHATRLLGKQAQRWPERQALALRCSRRTADVCQLNHRRIVRGDREALEAIAGWQSAA